VPRTRLTFVPGPGALGHYEANTANHQPDPTARYLEVIIMGGSYLHWGVVQISLTNFVVIIVMLVIFALAILVPFGRHHHDENSEDQS
jgi:uncharacterized membrane protein